MSNKAAERLNNLDADALAMFEELTDLRLQRRRLLDRVQRHDAALAAERRATVEPIEILMEHWRREAEAITGAMLENPNNVTGLHAARAAALNEVVVALYPIILDAEVER